MTDNQQPICILCGNTKMIDLGYRHNFQTESDRLGYSKYVTNISNFDKKIFSCPICGLASIFPPYSENDLNDLCCPQKYFDFLMSMADEINSLDAVSDIWINQLSDLGLTQWIENFVNNQQRKPKVLDVGCGHGHKLYTLNKMGCEVIGIEQNPYFCEYIKKNFSLPVIEGDLRYYRTDDKYDLIFSSHNIEHLENPVEYMALIKSFLSPDGIICIETPWAEDNGSYSNRYRDIYHNLFFNHTSLFILAMKAGFVIEKINYINFGTKGSYHKYIQLLLKPQELLIESFNYESINKIICSLEIMASDEINKRISLENDIAIFEKELVYDTNPVFYLKIFAKKFIRLVQRKFLIPSNEKLNV